VDTNEFTPNILLSSHVQPVEPVTPRGIKLIFQGNTLNVPLDMSNPDGHARVVVRDLFEAMGGYTVTWDEVNQLIVVNRIVS
jgi:hypothetical protein